MQHIRVALLRTSSRECQAKVLQKASHLSHARHPLSHSLHAMSSFRDSPMADQISQADIIFNRTNVALARSQRLIQSWLPTKPASEEEAVDQAQDEDEDEDFVGISETAGVGSKRKAEDEGLPDGAFRRKKLASNDKLLEQLLGKKAAQARKKTQGANGNAVGDSHVAVKQKPAAVRQAVESDDEEEGRAASFRSRKSKARHAPAPAPPVTDPRDEEVQQASEGHGEELHADITVHDVQSLDIEDSEPEERPRKKKAGSYLDEVLGQKAKKKKKGKKKTT